MRDSPIKLDNKDFTADVMTSSDARRILRFIYSNIEGYYHMEAKAR